MELAALLIYYFPFHFYGGFFPGEDAIIPPLPQPPKDRSKPLSPATIVSVVFLPYIPRKPFFKVVGCAVTQRTWESCIDLDCLWACT